MSILINGQLIHRSALRLNVEKPKRKRRRVQLPTKKMTVAEVYQEFARWKRTPQFAKWNRKQFLRQGGLCYYCQVYLSVVRENVEHITARSRGGTNAKSNLVLSCASCNKRKGSSMVSWAERARLKAANKPNRGEYLANKSHFDRLYGEYTDDAIADRLRDM